ncbi:MAG: hypothetical protein R3Y63_05220 [Eubacteriales bacterium]
MNKDCPCTYQGCPRHGDCKACTANHGVGNTSCAKKEKKEQ